MAKTQHERIEYVSAEEVRIQYAVHQNTMALHALNGKLRPQWEWEIIAWIDTTGQRALALCLECYTTTGSFEGLLTCNAIPFRDKLLRDKHGNKMRVTSVVGDRIDCELFEGSIGCYRIHDLRPLDPPQPPQPKYRAYETLDEAKGLIDVVIQNKKGKVAVVDAVGGVCVVTKKNLRLTFEDLFNEWTKANGEPCGVRIEREAAEVYNCVMNGVSELLIPPKASEARDENH